MNSYKSKLNQIRVVLGMAIKLAEETLVDGTVVSAEVFEPGYPVFVKTEAGDTPAPAGIHETESGLLVEVDEEGKIVSVNEKAAESSEGAEVEVEVEAAEEEVEVKVEEPEAMEEEVVEDKIKEALEQVVMAVEEIAKDVVEVKEKMNVMEEKYAKFAKEPAGKKFPTITNQEFSVDSADKIEARVAALQTLKKENFFKK